jgi:RNA polymerase sigma-B factor
LSPCGDRCLHHRGAAIITLGTGADILGDLLSQEDPGIQHLVDMQSVAAHGQKLPSREQRILLLRFYSDMTQRQIGARMGISQMHVSRLLDHAFSYLRERVTSPETA